MRKWIAIWLASLAMVAGLTSVLTRAQVRVPSFAQTPAPAPVPAPADAAILSGSDRALRTFRGQPHYHSCSSVAGLWSAGNGVASGPDRRRTEGVWNG
jgi:hypothetical protein